MRPYLAILRDSFHEALASKVLWVLLAVITVFLAALAPLGLVEEAGWYLVRGDLLDRDALVNKLAAAGRENKPSPARHVWTLLSPTLQAQMAQPPSGPDADAMRWQIGRNLSDELNLLLVRRDFFDLAAWEGVKMVGEVRGLLDRGIDKLAPDELARFNRLAMQAALPDQIATLRTKQIRLSYLGMELATPLPLNRQQLNLAINSLLLLFMVYMLGTVGVFIGILVTSSMIPQTFEPGAIDLLLSKPISRVWLFLSKFFGGLAFVAINATYSIVGLWLVVGWRFDLWNQKLLWCIPLYLFLFAIYYSVSALAGLWWRNAVLSVVATLIFWGVCSLVGLGKTVLETWALDSLRITRIVPAGDIVLAVNERGEVFRWEPHEGAWDPAFHEGSPTQRTFGLGSTLIGPVYDRKHERLVAIKAPPGRLGPLAGGSLLLGRQDESWRRRAGISPPDNTVALFATERGDILAATPRGLFRLAGDGLSTRPDVNIFGLRLPLPDAGGRFEQVGPALQLGPRISAACDAASRAVAIYDTRELVVLEPSGERQYRERARTSLSGEVPGIVALGQGALLLALADGRVQAYDPKSLALRATHEPEPSTAPRFAIASPDGRHLGFVFHNRRLALFDCRRQEFISVSVAGQGDISGAALAEGRLWVADHLTRATEYRIDNWQVVRRLDPPLELLEKMYHYVLRPVHSVFPKPSQLDQTMTYLLTEQDTAALLRPREELSARRIKLDVWGPVWSNLGFLAVLLAVACLSIVRKDF